MLCIRAGGFQELPRLDCGIASLAANGFGEDTLFPIDIFASQQGAEAIQRNDFNRPRLRDGKCLVPAATEAAAV